MFASKNRILDQIFIDCNLPPMDDTDATPPHEEEAFIPPRTMSLVNEKRTLFKGQMAREDILDYLVRVQNAHHTANHPIRR
jgi:hypothetical protein